MNTHTCINCGKRSSSGTGRNVMGMFWLCNRCIADGERFTQVVSDPNFTLTMDDGTTVKPNKDKEVL